MSITHSGSNVLSAPQHFQASASFNFHNKLDKPLLKKYGGAFNNQEWTQEDFVNHKTSGKTIAVGVFEPSHRCKQNFKSAQILGMDFDKIDQSISDWLEDPFIRDYAFLIMESVSSKPDDPHTHVFFLLSEAITDSHQYEIIMKRLSVKYQMMDEKCTDCARMFFGNETDKYVFQAGKVLPLDVLEVLPLPETQIAQPKKTNKRVKQAAEASQLSLKETSELEKLIRSALVYIPPWQEYDKWLMCLMAVHSKFPDQRGINIIENWSPGSEGEVAYKFSGFNRDGGIGIGSLFDHAQSFGWKFPVLQDQKIDGAIHINSRYLNENKNLNLIGRNTIIKSPMGTGKTESLRPVIEKSDSALLITNRTALARSNGDRLTIPNYQDVDDISSQKKLVIVVNSLLKLMSPTKQIKTFKVLIIDEIEQFLDHLIGGTLSHAEIINIYKVLCYLIENAETVIFLDAHAGETSKHFLEGLKADVQFIINDYKMPKKKMQMAKNMDVIRQILKQAVESDDPVGTHVVFVDSKKEAEQLRAYLAT